MRLVKTWMPDQDGMVCQANKMTSYYYKSQGAPLEDFKQRIDIVTVKLQQHKSGDII